MSTNLSDPRAAAPPRRQWSAKDVDERKTALIGALS